MPSYLLSPATHQPCVMLRRWLWLAVGTLTVAGLAPLVLLLGRGSEWADKALVKASFHDALVVHVDLSVLAWFLAILCLLWSLTTQGVKERIPYLRSSATAIFATGCVCIAFAPLLRDGTALMSNYVPVYTSALFFLG